MLAAQLATSSLSDCTLNTHAQTLLHLTLSLLFASKVHKCKLHDDLLYQELLIFFIFIVLVVATAAGRRPSVADWGDGVSASCTVGQTVR